MTEMSSALHPRLISDVRLADANAGDEPFQQAIRRTLGRLNGGIPLHDLVNAEPSLPPQDIKALLRSLDHAGLIDDDAPVTGRCGHEVILELEDIVESHCSATLFQNPFWQACLAARNPGDLPEKLVIGMIIENWHFLFRESYFDAPVLSYVPNTAVRLLLNQFFSEEYGHDEILLRALNFAGLSREDMRDAIPLPATMGLCNALAYWAHSDPLFFFSTLGLLEGQALKQDSFIDACERAQLPAGLVKPLKIHADINIGKGHGNLTRAIFQEIPMIDEATVARMKRQTRLFVELYDDFYTGIWRHYGSSEPLLLRRVSQL
ncbi:MAG: iron-containing redox enzyme family protein [Collimonas pratensis]|uniref:iron-containing redox enzyme family protein n=1 Tax=Collimonas pratensis TaxID=279113 RepID=UPI003C776611